MDTSKLFEVTDRTIGDVFVLRVIDGKFKGVEFTFGAIAVNEDDINKMATLKFEYNIIAGDSFITDANEFQQVAGDILMNMLDDKLNKNEVIYKGGTE